MPVSLIYTHGPGLISDFLMTDLETSGSLKINGLSDGKWNTFIYLTGGNGILQIDFDEFVALQNRIFFIEKYKIWHWIKNNHLKGILVQFTDSFYNHIYTGNPKLKSDQTLIGEVPPFMYLTHEEKPVWDSVFDMLYKEYQSDRKNSREVICLILKILILMYRRCTGYDEAVFESRQKKQLLNEFRKLVNNKFRSIRNAGHYARELNISPNYLNALCQEFFTKTVTQIIKERTILEAKRMLMHTRLNVNEISYRLGFSDNSYFCRYFRKEVGVTPKNFRKVSFNY